MKLNVGVIFGGKSVEHEVSIVSAIEIIQYFDTEKYNVIPIYLDKENNMYSGEHLKDLINYRDISLVKRYATKVTLTKNNKRVALQTVGFFKRDLYVLDLIMPIGHGTYTEDGSLQGYLNILGIPYVGSDVLASAISTDKIITKEILKNNNIPVANYVWIHKHDYISNKKKTIEKINTLKYPLYIKPASLGSSVGMTIANNEKELISGLNEAFKYDLRLIIEEEIPHVNEATISVFGDYSKQEILEENKINDSVDEEIPELRKKAFNAITETIKSYNAPNTKPIVSKEMLEDMKKYAIEAFKAMNIEGIAKIEFLINDQDKEIFVGEIDPNPKGLTGYLWLKKKKNQSELIDELISFAIKNFEENKELIYYYPENLLESFDIKE